MNFHRISRVDTTWARVRWPMVKVVCGEEEVGDNINSFCLSDFFSYIVQSNVFFSQAHFIDKTIASNPSSLSLKQTVGGGAKLMLLTAHCLS